MKFLTLSFEGGSKKEGVWFKKKGACLLVSFIHVDLVEPYPRVLFQLTNVMYLSLQACNRYKTVIKQSTSTKKQNGTSGGTRHNDEYEVRSFLSMNLLYKGKHN